MLNLFNVLFDSAPNDEAESLAAELCASMVPYLKSSHLLSQITGTLADRKNNSASFLQALMKFVLACSVFRLDEQQQAHVIQMTGQVFDTTDWISWVEILDCYRLFAQNTKQKQLVKLMLPAKYQSHVHEYLKLRAAAASSEPKSQVDVAVLISQLDSLKRALASLSPSRKTPRISLDSDDGDGDSDAKRSRSASDDLKAQALIDKISAEIISLEQLLPPKAERPAWLNASLSQLASRISEID